jgi:hypothetical protein
MHDIRSHKHTRYHENTGLGHKDQIIPETCRVLFSLPEQPSLAERVHVQRKNRQRDDS